MKHIVCFGDSNTYGLVPGTLKDRYAYEVRWTGRLETLLGDKEYRVIEEGLCGRTTVFEDPLRDGRKGASLLPVLLESHRQIDAVVLMLGTNDCKTCFDASAEVIGRGMERLIKQVRQENSQLDILVISPIWLGEGVGETGFDPEFNEKSVETSKRLKAVYQRIAGQYGCKFLAASDYAAPSETDREHMNEAGHEALAQAVYQTLCESDQTRASIA